MKKSKKNRNPLSPADPVRWQWVGKLSVERYYGVIRAQTTLTDTYSPLGLEGCEACSATDGDKSEKQL
jgi:hypothetical protein